MFVSRLRADLPKSLAILFKGLNMKKITFIDLSDNAVGPEIKAIE
jgi:Ran GTPase-activating protein (RanGAP) involved in mRNA processing and transport